MTVDKVKRYTRAFSGLCPYLVVGGRINHELWSKSGRLVEATYAPLERAGIGEFVGHILYFVSSFLVAVRASKENRNIQFVTNLFSHFTLGVVVIAIARTTHRKAVVRVASSASQILIRPGLRYRVLYPILKRLGEFALDQADAIVNISPMPLEKKNIRKTFELPFSIEYAASLAVSRTANMILFVGRLEPEKGVWTLLETAKLLTTNHPRIKVLVVGAGTLERALREEISHYHLSDRVLTKGFMAHARVIGLMRRATMLVVPSRDEYFPNVIIEAMFSGLPVVATRLGAVPYIIENMRTGILVPPDDPRSLFRAVETLLQDPRLRKRIALAAQRTAIKRFPSKASGQTAQRLVKYVLS